jgi:hypothetical protein
MPLISPFIDFGIFLQSCESFFKSLIGNIILARSRICFKYFCVYDRYDWSALSLERKGFIFLFNFLIIDVSRRVFSYCLESTSWELIFMVFKTVSLRIISSRWSVNILVNLRQFETTLRFCCGGTRRSLSWELRFFFVVESFCLGYFDQAGLAFIPFFMARINEWVSVIN